MTGLRQLPDRMPWGSASISALVVTFAMVLAGCAQPLRLPANAETVQGAPVSHWTGRLSLRVESEPPEAFSAGFDLDGNADQGRLLLTSPLGNALGQVQWRPGLARLEQSGKTVERSDLETLTRDMGGAALPVSAMFDWLTGRERQVSGWQVDLSDHASGRVSARRVSPLPVAELKIVFEP